MNDETLKKFEELLVLYPNPRVLERRSAEVEKLMALPGEPEGEEYCKLLDEWDDLEFMYDMFDKLHTYEEWKNMRIPVAKGEKGYRLNNKIVFHESQTIKFKPRSFKKITSRLPYVETPYPKYESPAYTDFAEEMDHDLGGIGFYQDMGAWGLD